MAMARLRRNSTYAGDDDDYQWNDTDTMNSQDMEEEEWVRVDIDDIDPNQLSVLLQAMSVASMSGESTLTFDGKEYKIEGDANDYRLYVRKSNGNSSSSGRIRDNTNSTNPDYKAPKAVRKRKTKRMFLLTDIHGLNDFEKSRFYLVKNVDGNRYVTILLNNDGEERTLLASRGQFVDVYDEPPFENGEEEKVEEKTEEAPF